MMKMNHWFTNRDCCPACNGKVVTQLLALPYLDPAIKIYLESFYNSQGSIDFSYLHDVDYIISKCVVCNLIFQKNIPSDELMEILYGKWIDPLKVFYLKDGCKDIEYFLNYSKQIANVIKYFGKKPKDLVFLDFGMGWGHWCRVAKSYHCKVYGNELTTSRIQYAKNEGIEVISKEDISKTKFDFINIDNVFEHISTPLEVLAYLKKSLKPDGLIRIYVPNGLNIENKIRNFKLAKIKLGKINEIAPLEHINCFNHESLIEMGKRVGLREVRVKPVYINTFGDLVDTRVLQSLYRFIGKRSTDVYFAQDGYKELN